MSMTKASMADFIDAHLDAITHSPTVGDGDATDHRRVMLEAFCQGVIDEIVANAVITTTSGAPDGEHTGNVSS